MLSRIFKKRTGETASPAAAKPVAADNTSLSGFFSAKGRSVDPGNPGQASGAGQGSFLDTISEAQVRAEREMQIAAAAQRAQEQGREAAVTLGQTCGRDGSPAGKSGQLAFLSNELDGLKAKFRDLRRAASQQTPETATASDPYLPATGNGAARIATGQSTMAVSGAGVMNAGHGGESVFSFNRLIGAVLHAWWLIIACGLIGAAIAAAYALSLPNKYQAIAEVLIEPRGLQVLENSVTPTGLNSEATVAYAESQVRIINSSSVIDPVIDELDLSEDPEFNGEGEVTSAMGQFFKLVFGDKSSSENRLSSTKKYLYENLYIRRINQTFTIQIGISTRDPQKSALIANTIADKYLKDESGARSSAARSASEDLTGRLDELRDSVRDAEEKVEKYRAENGLVDADGKLVSEVQLSRLNEQLALAKVQSGDARTRSKLATEADLADVISGSLPSALQTAAIGQLRVEYSRAKSRLDRLDVTLGQRHPDRVGAAAELRSARDAIAQEIQRIIRSTQEDFKRAVAREADLLSEVNTLKASAVNDSAAKVKLRELEREVEANRRVFESVLLRSRETSEQKNIKSESARVISGAVPPSEKEGPQRKLIVAGGGVVGAAFGAFLGLIPFMFGVLRNAAQVTGQPPVRGSMPPAHPESRSDAGLEGDLYSSDDGYSSSNGYSSNDGFQNPVADPQPASAEPRTVSASLKERIFKRKPDEVRGQDAATLAAEISQAPSPAVPPQPQTAYAEAPPAEPQPPASPQMPPVSAQAGIPPQQVPYPQPAPPPQMVQQPVMQPQPMGVQQGGYVQYYPMPQPVFPMMQPMQPVHPMQQVMQPVYVPQQGVPVQQAPQAQQAAPQQPQPGNGVHTAWVPATDK